MRLGNVFGHVCLSVQAITFEPLHIATSFFVWRYILTILRSSLSIRIIGLRSRSYAKILLLTYFNLLFLSMCLHVINKVKVTHQGQCQISMSRSHIKVNVTYQGQGQIKVIFKERCSYVGGLHLNQMRSCLKYACTWTHRIAVITCTQTWNSFIIIQFRAIYLLINIGWLVLGWCF